jgi:hypothetical protein
MLTGATCHQCKRKSEKPKMRCRNDVCEREYCNTCCARYDFEFDVENRSWICPFCMDTCNCGKCRARKGQAPLGVSAFGKTAARMEAVSLGLSLQTYLEQVQGEASPPKPEFDRIRLVDMGADIEAPELNQAWKDYLEEMKRPKKASKPKKRKSEAVGEGGKGNRITANDSGDGDGATPGEDGTLVDTTATDGNVDSPTSPAKKKRKPGPKKKLSMSTVPTDSSVGTGTNTPTAPIMLRLPAPPRPPTKEVDSDGETVHGYSDEEAVPLISHRQLHRSASASTTASAERQ